LIHYIHLYSSPGGIEVLLPRIIEKIPSKVIQSFVVRPPVAGQANVYEGKEIIHLYGSHKNRRAFWKLWLYARKHKDEVFHVFNIGPLNLLVLRLSGVKKLVYSIHGTIYWKTPIQKFIRRFFWKLALNKNYQIIANSRFSSTCFKNAMNYKKPITLVYNPFSSETFSPVSKKENNKLNITYCGRLADGKNMYVWIDLTVEIHRQNSNTEFYIYGNGPIKQQLQNYVAKVGMKEKIHFMGFSKNIAKAYRAADLLIFLSEYESFGNVAVESILCGTPVIVSDIPSMKEIFENYPEFIIPLDEKLTENVLSKITKLPELKAAASRAREEFKDRFSVRQHIKALEKIYNGFS
jgi:glycosyltransferase involved in cell wall biosynthesis